MNFDPDNKIIQLTIQGMSMEGAGKVEEAAALFMQAWNESVSDFEKYISAHYVARHQATTADKLKWDETALLFALKLDDETSKAHLPSLYLNIAKCHEDLKEFEVAKTQYQLADFYSSYLADDGYGKMIRAGIQNGIERSSKIENPNC